MVGVLIIYAATVAVFVMLFILVAPVLVRGLEDMRNRIVGERAEWYCVLANRGDRPVILEKAESSSPEFVLEDPLLPVELSPGARDTLMISFTPSTPDAQVGTLSIYGRVADAKAGRFELSLAGNNGGGADGGFGEPICRVISGPAQVAFSGKVHHFGYVAPGYMTRMEAQIKKLQPQLEAAVPMLKGVDIAKETNERIHGFVSDMLKKTPALVGSLISGITFVVIVPLVVFFFLSEGRAIKRAFIEMVPNQYFEMVLNLLYRIDAQLGGYIRGLVLSVIIISLLSITGLRIIGLNDYLVVGAVAGVANVIPYLGPIIGILAGVVAAVLQHSTLSLSAILPVVGVFLAVQVLDNVFVQPVVVARSVNLHPLVVVFVVLVGNQLFGAVGMLLAVPATAVVKVSVQTVYEGLRSYSIT